MSKQKYKYMVKERDRDRVKKIDQDWQREIKKVRNIYSFLKYGKKERKAFCLNVWKSRQEMSSIKCVIKWQFKYRFDEKIEWMNIHCLKLNIAKGWQRSRNSGGAGLSRRERYSC